MERKQTCNERRRSNVRRVARWSASALVILFGGCSLSLRGQTPDRSWPVAEYIRIGMPDPAKFWTASDYAIFSGILHDLDRTNRAAFPRLDSSNSGALFARVINATNTVLCLEANLPAGDRLKLYQSLLIFIPSIFDVYKLSGNDMTFHHETVELAHVHLHLLRLAIEQDNKPMPGPAGSPSVHLTELTIHPWNSQGSPDNFKVPRKGSFGIVGAHAAATLCYLVPWLGDPTVVPESERRAAIRYLNEDVPLLWGHIVPATRRSLMQDLVVTIEGTRHAEIREGLEKLRKQLAATNEAP